MKSRSILAALLATTLIIPVARAQMAEPTVETHIDAAKKAALFDWTGIFARNCAAPLVGPPIGNYNTDPGRALWYSEPYKVFDNLYFLGTQFHTAWALVTSDGIILIDTLYNYAIEPEIIEGMKKMGLDPAKVKYVLITHGHGDHDQGAKLFQDRYGAKVIMGAGDWDATMARPKEYPGGIPKREMNAVDGGKLTLGDTTVTMILTPAHSPGAYGLLFNVKEKGRPVSVAYPSGTAMRFNKAFFPEFIASQEKMAKAAADAKATVLISNHTAFDNAWTLSRLAAWRPAGVANPFEIGTERVQNYFKVMVSCSRAGAEYMDKH